MNEAQGHGWTVSYAPVDEMVTDAPELSQALEADCSGCGKRAGEWCICVTRVGDRLVSRPASKRSESSPPSHHEAGGRS